MHQHKHLLSISKMLSSHTSLIIIIVLVGIVTLVENVKLPPNFQKCNRNQPDLKECILSAAQDGASQLTKSFDELNIPNVFPLEIPEITLGVGKGAVAVEQHFKNCKFYGLHEVKLDTFEFDFDQKTLTVGGIFPEVTLKSDYELDGQILLLPVKGEGRTSLILQNVTVGAVFHYQTVKKRGKTYISFYKNDIIKLDPENAVFNYENLFGGDKVLGDNINKVLNENWKLVIEDLRDSYFAVINEILIKLLNNFFAKVSLEEALD